MRVYKQINEQTELKKLQNCFIVKIFNAVTNFFTVVIVAGMDKYELGKADTNKIYY